MNLQILSTVKKKGVLTTDGTIPDTYQVYAHESTLEPGKIGLTESKCRRRISEPTGTVAVQSP